MTEFRHDPINDQWVAIAANRQARPLDFTAAARTPESATCPFCLGNEHETPPALAVYRDDGKQISTAQERVGWTARVVPNKYPYIHGDAPPAIRPGNGNENEPGPYQSMPAQGVQEIIVPSPRHVTTLSGLTDTELLLSFQVYQQRIARLKSVPQVEHAMLFLNCGLAAGASVAHIHTQLIGSPLVSANLSARVDRNAQHAAEWQHAIMASLANWEIDRQTRIIDLTDDYCIVCPFASRFAYQIWIIPRRQSSDFPSCPVSMRDELAMHCRSLVARLESLLKHPDYNVLLHVEPFHANSGAENWYVEIMPRLTRLAGFELGTDIWVNPVSPESAADLLRLTG